MLNILSVIFNCVNSCKSTCTTQSCFKDLFLFLKFFCCLLLSLPTFVETDEINTTELELDTNYTIYNISYENFTLYNQSIVNSNISNKIFNATTEVDSSLSVTEDSFQSESNRKVFHFLTPDEGICNCDLTTNVCDINCCCDEDCDEDHIQVFSECSHQTFTPNENYCYQEDVILRNNTVYKMVKHPKSAMFCIVHDNLKHSLRFQDMPILKSHRDLMTVLKYKYRTTYSWDTYSKVILNPSELRVGNPVYVTVKSSKKIITNRWSLPSSCLSDLCSCKEDVRYLRDFQSSCTYSVGNLQESCERHEILSGDHVSDFCISQRSTAYGHSLADLVVHTMAANASEDDSTKKLCIDKSPKRPTKGTSACENVVRYVHFTVVQDGTNGITGIVVNFKYVNVTFDKRSVTQSYSVNFTWSNTSSESYEKKSGNPGYQVGFPILAATNNCENEGGRMFRIWYSVLGDGLCSSSGNRRLVKFGKNLKTACFLRHNFTHCTALRTAISDILLGPNKRQMFVGVFGNANASDRDDWIEVFHETSDLPDDDGNGCFVSLGLEVDIMYAAVGTVANPQHKIVGIGYHYSIAEFVDLMHSKDIVLSTSVSFFDITLPAVEHYAKVPSIRADLPSDFFYPFMYSGASSDTSISMPFIFIWLCYFLMKCF